MSLAHRILAFWKRPAPLPAPVPDPSADTVDAARKAAYAELLAGLRLPCC